MIYIASPFFNDTEMEILRRTEEILTDRGYEIFSPRQHEVPGLTPETPEWSTATFQLDREAIDRCDLMVMIYHGNYSDTGTAWECGYAYAKGKPVIAIHEGDSSNLMVHESVTANITIEELETYDLKELKKKGYSGKMY